MSHCWVVKAGGVNDGPHDGEPEYLHRWEIGTHCEIKDPVWVTDQRLAYRFLDRNFAAQTCNRFPISAYSEDVRLVKLTAKSTPEQRKDEDAK
jgi:hypothetical protein